VRRHAFLSMDVLNMTSPMAQDEYERLVAGDRLETTIAQFKQRASVILLEEQAKANPDNYLISFACDAIRLAREHCLVGRLVADRPGFTASGGADGG
jgi:hypothetical protein